MQIRLEAINSARNVARFYEVTVEPDLFGFVVVVQYGRIGAGGRRQVLPFDTEVDAEREFHRRLGRRRSAPRRIGAPYVVVSKNG